MIKRLLILVFTPVFLASCAKKTVPSDVNQLGVEYYPTKQGKYVIYSVDSIVYSDLLHDTAEYKYQIKEKIADTYTDNSGRPATRLERYIRKYNAQKPYDSIPWTMKEVWMVNADTKAVQVLESNVRYTKLSFPVREKDTWNGNALNTLGEWMYTYNYIDRSETIGQTKFDKVLLVAQKNFVTAISHQAYNEKYAKGIGLVYREIIDVNSSSINPSVPVLNRISKGIVYKQIFVSSGYE